ncbi:hypothetical protein MKZ07_09645 [Paenibacillus sp. FSL P4-0338]|uniref:hypothetical protein n=1 Tax=unclassified Paenibacillus TaxID=185978 RepID=UPI0003E20411|nr:hypothetical protein [Paenibacillus sp. FSL R7-269]ETT53694.1 hypothetical protein C162_06369 [Paenibacillus sp. FSL R7-269]
MIKNRFFMLGLGIGLIAGALLLQLMIAGRALPLTKEELIRQAASMNLTIVDPAEAAATATPSPEKAAEAKTSGAPAATPASTPVVPPKPAAAPSVAATPGKPSAPAQPQSTASPVTKTPVTPEAPVAVVDGVISLKIPTGITLAQTADLLAEAGVIEDKNKFLQTADSRKVNTIIQYGSYSFNKGESINSIIDKLITVKK